MARPTKARLTALALLGEVRRREAHARDVLRASSRMEALDARDRAFVARLVLGVTGARGYVDGVVREHASRRIDPKVFDALRLGAYEALFLATPSSVAVSQGVELVRSVRPHATGFANAVLRGVVSKSLPERERARRRVAEGSWAVSDLSCVSGYPTWLLERVRADRGDKAVCVLALSALDPAPVFVAANRSLRSTAETRVLLERAGLGPRDADAPDSFVLASPAGLHRSGLVGSAEVIVADLSAQRVACLAAPRPGDQVLEVGQGRGTKTILLQNAALRAGGPVRVVGVDSEAFKTRVAAERMECAGLGPHVSCVTLDACELADDVVPDVLACEFDLVFVDAPCSGTGTMRRHPEIPWSLSETSLDRDEPLSLPRLQERMLAAAASRVRRGGRLCYATCSMLRAENEHVVEAFLASEEGSGFALEGEPFQSIPSQGGPDGHFCARLVRA